MPLFPNCLMITGVFLGRPGDIRSYFESRSYLEKRTRHPGNFLPVTPQTGKERRKIAKTSPKSKERFVQTASVIFLVAAIIEFFSLKKYVEACQLKVKK